MTILLLLFCFIIKCSTQVRDGLVIEYVLDENQDTSRTIQEHNQLTNSIPETSGIDSSISAGPLLFTSSPGNEWSNNSMGIMFNRATPSYYRTRSSNTVTKLSSAFRYNEISVEVWFKLFGDTPDSSFLEVTSRSLDAQNVFFTMGNNSLLFRGGVYNSFAQGIPYLVHYMTTQPASPGLIPVGQINTFISHPGFPSGRVIHGAFTMSNITTENKVHFYWRDMNPSNSAVFYRYIGGHVAANITRMWDVRPNMYFALAGSPYFFEPEFNIFYGMLYQARIYNRVLTSAELDFNWQKGLPNSIPILSLTSKNYTIMRESRLTVSWSIYDFDNVELFKTQVLAVKITSIKGNIIVTDTLLDVNYTENDSRLPITLSTLVSSIRLTNKPGLYGTANITMCPIDSSSTGRCEVIIFNLLYNNKAPVALNTIVYGRFNRNTTLINPFAATSEDGYNIVQFIITSLPTCGLFYRNGTFPITTVPFTLQSYDFVKFFISSSASISTSENRTAYTLTCSAQYKAVDSTLNSSFEAANVEIRVRNPILAGVYDVSLDSLSGVAEYATDEEVDVSITLPGYNQLLNTNSISSSIISLPSSDIATIMYTNPSNNVRITLSNSTINGLIFAHGSVLTFRPSLNVAQVVEFPYITIANGLESEVSMVRVSVNNINDQVLLVGSVVPNVAIYAVNETRRTLVKINLVDVDSVNDTFAVIIKTDNNGIRFTCDLISSIHSSDIVFDQGNCDFDKSVVFYTNKYFATALLNRLYITCIPQIEITGSTINITVVDNINNAATATSDTFLFYVACDVNVIESFIEPSVNDSITGLVFFIITAILLCYTCFLILYDMVKKLLGRCFRAIYNKLFVKK